MNQYQGISILLCCYNSSKLVYETLRCLSKLIILNEYPVELVFVDNASTDSTVDIVLKHWDEFGKPFPINQLIEKKQGLYYARKKGIENAKYEYLVFVDDDNHLAADYLLNLVDILEKYPKVGVVGGLNTAVFESKKPFWFEQFKQSYATGKLADSFGEPHEIGLFGAGLVVRKSAHQYLLDNGFEQELIGRKGELLSSGEDYEFCKAMKISGWEVLYAPQLQLDHFMCQHRLTWDYFLKLNRGISSSFVYFLAYEYWIEKGRKPKRKFVDFRYSFSYLVFKKFIKKMLLRSILIFKSKNDLIGSNTFIEHERSSIVLIDLIKKRRKFSAMKKSIGVAAWNRLSKT